MATNNFYGFKGNGCVNNNIYPTAPTGFACTQVDNTTMDLGWDETLADFQFLEVERSLTAGNYVKILEQLPAAVPGAVTFTDTGLTINTRYYYRFRVKKRFKMSEYQTDNEITTNV
jgi:hypothetical protein